MLSSGSTNVSSQMHKRDLCKSSGTTNITKRELHIKRPTCMKRNLSKRPAAEKVVCRGAKHHIKRDPYIKRPVNQKRPVGETYLLTKLHAEVQSIMSKETNVQRDLYI